MLTTSWSASRSEETPSGSGPPWVNALGSLDWSCIRTRPACWSSVAMRQIAGLGVVLDGLKCSRFLGFVHSCGTTREGRFTVRRPSRPKAHEPDLEASEGTPSQAPLPPSTRTGCMAGSGDSRVRPVLRCTGHIGGAQQLPEGGELALVSRTATPKPEDPSHLGANASFDASVASNTPYRSSKPLRALACLTRGRSRMR